MATVDVHVLLVVVGGILVVGGEALLVGDVNFVVESATFLVDLARSVTVERLRVLASSHAANGGRVRYEEDLSKDLWSCVLRAI
jgi:hypothetical protein